MGYFRTDERGVRRPDRDLILSPIDWPIRGRLPIVRRPPGGGWPETAVVLGVVADGSENILVVYDALVDDEGLEESPGRKVVKVDALLAAGWRVD